MKRFFTILSLFLLVSCGNIPNANSSVPVGNSSSETPTSSTPILESSSSFASDLSSSMGYADDPLTYHVKGHFIDDKNHAIQGLTVGLYDEEKCLLNSSITDKNGAFSFLDLLEGKYYLSILRIENDKYKNTDGEWEFEVYGESLEITLDNIVLEIDTTIWSDLV